MTAKIKVDTVPIDDVTPADYNPRVWLTEHDAEWHALRTSIERFGLVEPLVVNRRTGHLVGGHQRLAVLKDLGHTDVPVAYVDVDDTNEKQLNLALNRLKGRWSNPKLANLLVELEAAEADGVEGILAATGFSTGDVSDVLRRADAESAASALDQLIADEQQPGSDVPTGKEERTGPTSSTGSTDDTVSEWFTFTLAVPTDARDRIIRALDRVRETNDLASPAEALVWLLHEWSTQEVS